MPRAARLRGQASRVVRSILADARTARDRLYRAHRKKRVPRRSNRVSRKQMTQIRRGEIKLNFARGDTRYVHRC